MSIPIATNKIVYAGDGQTVDFPTPQYADETDILAIYRTSGGSSATLVLGTDYTLSQDQVSLAGTLTIINGDFVPDPALGSTLIVMTNLPLDQQRQLPTSGPLPAEEIEAALDKLTQICQQLNDQVRASVRAPLDDLVPDMVLPVDALRAGQVLTFDDQGRPLPMTFAALSAIMGPIITGEEPEAGTFFTAAMLGLKGDSVTNDSAALNRAVQYWTQAGGATFFLQPQEGRQFVFNDDVVVRSFVNVIFGGASQLMGKNARMRIAGQLSVSPTDTDLQLRVLSTILAGSNNVLVDTAPSGGGAVSAYLAVNDRVQITGRIDGAGNPVDQFVHRITGINDTTKAIILDPVLQFTVVPQYPPGDYEAQFQKPNFTKVVRVNLSLMTANVLEGANVIPLNSVTVGIFAIEDYVVVSDDKTCADEVAGLSAGRIHGELAQIIDIGADGPSTITLNRRLEHPYETAFRARVTLIEPAIRASIQGASLQFTAAPDPSPALEIEAFDISHAVESAMYDVQVANEDNFGRRGAMFRCMDSLDSHYVRPTGRNPKSLLAPDGVGVLFKRSTSCSAIEPTLAGCRDSVRFEQSTHCQALAVQSKDDRRSVVAFAGQREVGCIATLRDVSGGTRFAGDVSRRAAIRMGELTNGVGPQRCVIQGGRVGRYMGVNTAVVQLEAGALECVIRDLQCDDISTLLFYSDNPNAAALTCARCSVENVTANGFDGALVNCHGGRNGSPNRTLVDLTLRDLRAYGGSQLLFLQQINGAVIRDATIDDMSVDLTEPYILRAGNVLRLIVHSGLFRGARAGLSLQNCVSFRVLRNDFVEQNGTTVVIQDLGGNTNGSWHMNDYLGFTATKDIVSASTGIDYSPAF